VNHAYVAIGSNIRAAHNVRQAVRRLAQCCTLVAVSPIYETAPVGTIGQPSFLNAAALIETELSAAALKAQVLQAIEHALGRVRTADKNAPRTIDLDITLYNDEILDVGHRHIPDPDLLVHPHIAVPIADLAPEYRHPETGQTLREIAADMPASDLVLFCDIVL
jgi:2-amino-4-hydroxy-6-hydroxymethyldihydropteridine diphosphokinase